VGSGWTVRCFALWRTLVGDITLRCSDEVVAVEEDAREVDARDTDVREAEEGEQEEDRDATVLE
jgi:hypothetical protein